MLLSQYTAERVTEIRQQELRQQAQQERLARSVVEQKSREGRQRLQLRGLASLGSLLVRLGTRLAGKDAGRPATAAQSGSTG